MISISIFYKYSIFRWYVFIQIITVTLCWNSRELLHNFSEKISPHPTHFLSETEDQEP